MIKIKNQSLKKWKVWLENELVEDGKENQVFNLNDIEESRKIYKYIVEAFLELIQKTKEKT